MLQLNIIRRVGGIMLMVFAITLLPSQLLSLVYDDGKFGVFFSLFLFTSAAGYLLYRNTQVMEPKTRDGFVIVVLIWFGYSLIGALPFVWGMGSSYTDAVFEVASGLTTTGATVYSGLDNWPRSMLWYRIQTHLIGGLGVLILAVAILPLFNIGGMKLYKAEATGPVKDDKLTPRIAHTARIFFGVYIALIIADAFGLWALGMNWFDALTHSISAVATGGFANYDASIAHFNSVGIEIVLMLGMLAGGLNFGLHFLAWRDKRPFVYFGDQEARAFLLILATAIGLMTFAVWATAHSPFWQALREVAFTAVSIITCCGFVTVDPSFWPMFVPFMMMMLAYFGGCTGSTGGGIKILRIYLLFKQASREAKKLIQPNIVAHIKYNGRVVPDEVCNGVMGFFALWVLTAAIATLLMMACGLSPVAAFGAVAATINNMGIGLNEVATSFASVTVTGKWVLIFTMLIGRLEIFTVFVLFVPLFWRKF